MGLTKQEKDNLTRWDGRRKGFYEVYFIKFNHLDTKTALWIRLTLLSPLKGEPLAEVWGIFFDLKNPGKNRAIKKSFPASAASIARDRFSFSIGGATMTQTGSSGGLIRGKN